MKNLYENSLFMTLLEKIVECPCSATHKHTCTTMGNAAYCGMKILPSPCCWGKDYDSEKHAFIIAQNPGFPWDSERPEDRAQYREGLNIKDRIQLYYESLIAHKRIQSFTASLGLSWDKLFWTNLAKCPTDKNRPLSDHEVELCHHFLERQLDFVRPRIIVALGWIACQYFKLSKLNQPQHLIDGSTIFGTNHYAHASNESFASLRVFLKQVNAI